MTKFAALAAFFGSFGIPAYPVTSVPDNTVFPWLTYEAPTGFWEQQSGITVNLWYYTESEAVPNAKAEEIGNAIGLGGIMLPCDGGAIRLTRGDPWCQPIADENTTIKRRYLNVTAEFLTI